MKQIHLTLEQLGPKLTSLWIKLHSYLRRVTFPYQVSWQGGKLSLGKSVQFAHDVKFQGKGALIIEDHVKLGFWMAGGFNRPILLQPREAHTLIKIGTRTAIVNGCELLARTQIIIGSDCRIGSRCIFMDADFHGLRPDERNSPGISKPIVIEDNVWFGTEAMILKGVHIGKDAVIGARCTVSKDVLAGAIAVGNPMRIVGSVYD